MVKLHHAFLLVGTLCLAGALCGCNENEIISTLTQDVDPYASNVEQRAQEIAEDAEAKAQAREEAKAQAELERQLAEQRALEAQLNPPEPEPEPEPADTSTHYEGEYVFVTDSANTYTVHANWTHDDWGNWVAAFYTYNMTRVYCYQEGSGWRFTTTSGQPIIFTTTPSSAFGQVGPSGLESNWRSATDASVWY